MLDLLRAHKWIVVMLATDNALRVAHKLKTEKRSIDILRETYSGHNNDEIPTLPHVEADKPSLMKKTLTVRPPFQPRLDLQ
ncbi:MAG: hypothetical protein ACO2PM_03115 [Pyrobaculum sp.]